MSSDVAKESVRQKTLISLMLLVRSTDGQGL